MNNTCDLRVEFVKRMMEVKGKMVWDDEKLAHVKANEDSPTFKGDDGEDEGFIEDYITPGGIIRLPVNTHTKSIRAMYVRQKNEEKSSYVRSMQKKLCRVLSLCDQVSTVNIDITKTKDLYGYSYIELKISEDARALLNATSIDFELQIEFDNRQPVRKRFSLNCPAKRQKRAISKQYLPWIRWITQFIRFEYFVPKYQQFTIIKGGQSCYVGSAAVAWATVFGYYDRRSHRRTSTFGNGSQPLYACSYNGAYGSSVCVAPTYATRHRVRQYIKMLNYVLGTWCRLYTSGTPAGNMDRVKRFFQSRQKSGAPTILQTSDAWSEQATYKIAAQTRAWIKSGWPVVVGTNEGGVFIKHYSVTSRYRLRSRKWRYVTNSAQYFKSRTVWRIQTQFQMYVHQGSAIGSVKWRPMSIHYAAIAQY